MRCEHTLAYLPDRTCVGSLEAASDGEWTYRPRGEPELRYQLCANYRDHSICNWAIPATDSGALCLSCRFTRTIPDLTREGHKEAWYRLEVAKRRLLYTLLALGLPLATIAEDPEHGLAFDFVADPTDPNAPPALTGHNRGVISINVAEADDAERERRKQALGEPYRTLLGHFRHEIGHYYWSRLIDGRRLDAFRALFGDERDDYAAALQRHYEQGAPADWQQRFVTAYASAHPWEDWAETWAHYVHMRDTLETATECGLSLRPSRPGEPSLKPDPQGKPPDSFDRMIEDWFSVTYVMNNLNRGLGLADAYPFVLSPAAVEKLAFVHGVVDETSGSGVHSAQASAAFVGEGETRQRNAGTARA